MANNKLTSEQKMEMWHNGERKQNVKQMGNDKLEASYKICVEKNYTAEAEILKAEMTARGI